MNRTNTEEFLLILRMVEDFYIQAYQQGLFVDLAIEQSAKLSLQDPAYLNVRKFEAYQDQVERIIAAKTLDREGQEKTLTILKLALKNLEESLHAFTGEV